MFVVEALGFSAEGAFVPMRCHGSVRPKPSRIPHSRPVDRILDGLQPFAAKKWRSYFVGLR